MPTPPSATIFAKPSLPFVLLLVLFATLFLAGGSSRPEIFGQVVVRAAATVVLVIAILFGPRPDWRGMRAVALFMVLIVALPLLQLIPLPPEVWQALPGRAPIAKVAELLGEAQPWRPLSMVPGATVNAAASLLVPATTLVLMGQLARDERRSLIGPLLVVIAASAFVGALQFSGVSTDNPLNDTVVGKVSGFFGNSNHFALLLAVGCAAAPVWAFAGDGLKTLRGFLALGAVLVFVLAILASGSRAGIALAVLGVGAGLLLSHRDLRYMLRRYPRWTFPALIFAALGLVAGLALLSVLAGRADSIERFLIVDAGTDMRARALPTVFEMLRIYLPVGTGFGSFDPVFRMHEPFELLAPGYFNHVHNDLLEIALDGGIPGAALLAAALFWWAFQSWRALRRPDEGLALLGAAVVLLTILASLVDYPARTPMIMAVLVVSAAWLGGSGRASAAALPASQQ